MLNKVFRGLTIDYKVRGGTTVSWGLRSTFTAPGPHAFSLEVSRGGVGELADWETIVGPEDDVSRLIDPEWRFKTGAWRNQRYRVRLDTPMSGVYYSDPLAPDGGCPLKVRLRANKLIYEWRKRGGRGRLNFVHGWLLKRRYVGNSPANIPGVRVSNPITGSLVYGTKPNTAGSAVTPGYYKAEPFIMELVSLGGSSGRSRDGLGSTDGKATMVEARCVTDPIIHEDDLFIDAASDRRYYLGEIKNLALAGHVPFLVKVPLTPAKDDDVAYSVPLPDVPLLP
jgi:hypothetical protein